MGAAFVDDRRSVRVQLRRLDDWWMNVSPAVMLAVWIAVNTALAIIAFAFGVHLIAYLISIAFTVWMVWAD